MLHEEDVFSNVDYLTSNFNMKYLENKHLLNKPKPYHFDLRLVEFDESASFVPLKLFGEVVYNDWNHEGYSRNFIITPENVNTHEDNKRFFRTFGCHKKVMRYGDFWWSQRRLLDTAINGKGPHGKGLSKKHIPLNYHTKLEFYGGMPDFLGHEMVAKYESFIVQHLSDIGALHSNDEICEYCAYGGAPIDEVAYNAVLFDAAANTIN